MSHDHEQRRAGGPTYAVSQPHDTAETQAAHAADTVARGGSVAGWSFERVPARALHREAPGEEKKPKPGTPGDAVKALAATKIGKQAIEKVKETKEVKAVLGALDTPAGKVAAVGAGAAALGGFAAAGKELPTQIPAIPVGKVAGLDTSATLTIKGPVNNPSFVGVSLTFSAPSSGKSTKKDDVAADIARLRAQSETFRDSGEKAAEAKAVMDYVVAQQSARLKPFLIPLRTGDAPQPAEAPVPAPTAEEAPKKDEEPVQRDADPAGPSTGTEHVPGQVDRAVAGSGQPLQPDVRAAMEARFGHDFGAVRVHDGPDAAAAAGGLGARAFTVGGEHVVFGAGRHQPHTAQGRRLLAHELAHVVQQRPQGRQR